MSTTYTEEEVARLNRMVADVFWLRFGREFDRDDREDQARVREIMDWQSRCGPLPRESAECEAHRVAALRALRELAP